jgi:16S rRNA (guanine(527)-N(7))-methyltransferase RsmG
MSCREDLKRLLIEYSIPVASLASLQLASYLDLLEKWNRRINLTSSTTWPVIGPMFREGIWASGKYPEQAIFHLDIGSGAGFPALLLKIFNPRMELELVDSREKKCIFLETAAQTLGLNGVRVHNMRLEDFLGRCAEEVFWDCISWKALKLSTAGLIGLQGHARSDSQFWMFHGHEPAVTEKETLSRHFELIHSGKIPDRNDWNLSIYRACFT